MVALPDVPSPRSHWKLLFIVIISVVVVYARTVTYDFVTYDDYELVVHNEPYLSHPSNLFNAFTTHAFTSHRAESGYYRPILLVSYMADYRVWQLDPFGYHLTNIVLHCCSAVVLFLLLHLLFKHSFASFLGTLLFALHPVQTESVGWVAGRNDVLLGLFILLMALFYGLSLSEGNRKGLFRALSVVAFVTALFTKESAAFYLLLLPVIDVSIEHPPIRSFASLRYGQKILPFVIVLGGYLIIRTSVIGSLIGAEALYGTTPLAERCANVPAIVSEHLKFIVIPFGYSIVHPVEELLWQEQLWSVLSWCITLLLTGGIGWSWAKNRSWGTGGVWFGVGLLPLLGVFPLAVQILEHRLYVPMAGIAIAVAGYLARMLEVPARRKAIATIAVAVLASYAILSTNRLRVWANSETLWRDAIEKAPAASRSYFNLAGYYFEHQQYEKTVELMKAYIGLKPNDAIGYIKLRQTLQLAGRTGEAAEVQRELLECYRRLGDTTKVNELSRQLDREPQ